MVYLKKKRYLKRINLLCMHIDKNESGFISLNEYFDLVDCLEKNPWFSLPLFPDL